MNREPRTPAGISPGGGLLPIARVAAGAALVAAVPFAIALGLLVADDVLDLGNGFIAAVLIVTFAAVTVMLAVGLRDLRLARARTTAALDRAATAESAQRARADELAHVLEASETLAFTGEGQVDYLGVLAAITPNGMTSFLVRIEGATEAVVAAAHGPLASSVVGLRRPIAPAEAGLGPSSAQVSSFSASGQTVGRAMADGHMPAFEGGIEAGLAVSILDHDGRRLGWLHMIEPRDERILEPSFVNLAQLVATQIGVAMENHALLARVRQQLIEVQRVQQQLVQASKLSAVGELAAAVAHEVNNPLTGILGFSELLMTELPEDDARHEEALVIRNEAIRARAIVKTLLEFARPRLPQRTPTDLNELTRATLELIRFRASQTDVEITAEYGELPCVEIDADAFGQVLLNLFNNAIDAMPYGGQLRVKTVCESERVGVVIADAGIGMDESTRGRIFTPFFSTRSGKGTGLGLSVSLKIVESHDGTIEVESAPGQGSTFTVWLPTTHRAFEGTVLVPGAAAAPTAQATGDAAHAPDATPGPKGDSTGGSTRNVAA